MTARSARTGGQPRLADPTAAWDQLSPTYLTRAELEDLDLAAVGDDVRISRDVRLYGAASISIGSHVRIDDFTVISAGAPVVIGNHVHIHSFCGLYGQAGIVMEDFSGVSGRVSIYTASDDYSGRTMTNPTVPAEYKRVKAGPVHLGRHVIVGTGAVLLPGVTIGEGSAVGALSLVAHRVEPWTTVSGVPAKKIADRRRDLLELEARLLDGERDAPGRSG